jgi:hypothetical protein
MSTYGAGHRIFTWFDISLAPMDGRAILACGVHDSSPPDAHSGVKPGDPWWAIILWDKFRGADKGGQRWVFAKDGKPTWSAPQRFGHLPQVPDDLVGLAREGDAA